MADWYYGKGGERLGPISQEELQSLADDGTLAPSDLVWTSGMENWTEAGSVDAVTFPPSTAGEPPSLPPTQVTGAGPAGPPPHPSRPGAGSGMPGGGGFDPNALMATLGLEGMLIAGGALVAFISCFLPWLSYEGLNAFRSASLTWIGLAGIPEGILCFLLSIAVGIVVFLHYFNAPTKHYGDVFRIIYVAAGGAIVLLSLIFVISRGRVSEASEYRYDSGGFTFGVFITLLAGAAICAGGVMLLLKANKGGSSH